MQETELTNPVSKSIESVCSPLPHIGENSSTDDMQRKKDILHQLSFEIEKGKGYFRGYDIAIYKCKGRVVRYGEMAVAKCIVSFPHTILVEGESWMLLNCLTVLCFATMFVCVFTGSAESMTESNVTGRVQTLLGFVLSGHVGQVLSRWSQLRFNTFGPMWGNIENFCLLLDQIFLGDTSEVAVDLRDKSKRYGRLVMQLLFFAVQERDDIPFLTEMKLLDPKEASWLQACPTGTRPLMVVGWMMSMWEDIKKGSPHVNTFVGDSALQGIKGGIGGTMGMLGCPLPYSYVHVVYWTVQILLCILAVETGTMLSIYLIRKENGDEDYAFDDDSKEWPAEPTVWYFNEFLQVTCGNIVFAVFTVGLLKVCDKLSNPFKDTETSFPEFLYDKALNNNMHALAAGLTAYSEIYPGHIAPKLPAPAISSAAALASAAASKSIPPLVGLWSHEDVVAWVRRSSDAAYRECSLAERGNKSTPYYCTESRPYRDCAHHFLARGITGAVLLTLSEDELEADFGMSDKYQRRAFMCDLANLRLQMSL